MEKRSKKIWISMIIPVFNVREYLYTCVQSILSQGDFDGAYEMILVDDGSTDGSGRICEKLGQQYAFIHVLHQKNAGLGAARNAGIRAAAGEYLLFVDADDFIGSGSLKRILGELEKNPVDVCFLDSYKYFGKGRFRAINDSRLKQVNTLGKSGCMRLLAKLSKYPGSACDKLVRRGLAKQYQIFFEEGLPGEDLVWVLKCLLYAKTYRYVRADFYYYRQNRSGSITSRFDAARFAGQIHAVRQGAALAAVPEGRRYRKEIYAMMAYEAEVALLFFGMLPEKRTKHKKWMEDVLWLTAYRNGWRTIGIRLMIRGIGMQRTAKLLALWYGRKRALIPKMCGRRKGNRRGWDR